MDEPSDIDLVDQLGSSDRAERQKAFTTLFERHSRRAYDLAHRVLNDRALAHDAVQEAFIRVYKKGARFQARARFTSWLYRVVLNKCIDLRRREKRHRMASLGPRPGKDGALSGSGLEGGVPEPAAPASSGPHDVAIVGERAEIVQWAITQLSPKLAEVIVLRYPQGLSYEEIGEILEVPPGTVKSRLNRAHAALRIVLAEALGEADSEPGPQSGV